MLHTTLNVKAVVSMWFGTIMFNEMLNVYHIVDQIAITIFVKIINLLLPVCAAYLIFENITNFKKNK